MLEIALPHEAQIPLTIDRPFANLIFCGFLISLCEIISVWHHPVTTLFLNNGIYNSVRADRFVV
jgi:hypothetical protein